MTLAIESRFRDAHLSVHLDNFAALTQLSERAVGDHGRILESISCRPARRNSNGVVSACRRTLLIEQRHLERLLINRLAIFAFA